jgi:MFS family permease
MTLAAGQFVMALDTTVMNTAIATVAKDLGTTVTGIQTAITLYTLVMASLMITGGKIGQMIGRKRAFAIGCIVYACGSLTTALSQNLTMLMIGWSGLEGLGAVLIMPAIVALVASNFTKPDRPRAYGLVAAAGAIAAALGPLVGGLFTSYASWRWVFAGEVVIVIAILLLTRRMNDTPAEEGARLDLVGTALSALGLGAIVLGILKAGTWGFVRPKPDAPEWFGLSPVIWLVFAGAGVLVLFVWWESRRIKRGEGALIDPGMLRNLQLRNGVMSFLFMFLIQAGIFFTVPLFLSVALGISAVETGVRLLPLSLSLLVFAVGVPRVRPEASPRRVVRLGFLMLFAGLVLLVGLLDDGVGPEIVTWPLLLAGAGLGMMASQLGADLRDDRVVLHRHREQPQRPRSSRLAGTNGTRWRRAVHVRGRREDGAEGGERPHGDRQRDRQGEPEEPDRRTARRGGHPCAPRPRCPPVQPRNPDRPTRHSNQAQSSARIAGAAACHTTRCSTSALRRAAPRGQRLAARRIAVRMSGATQQLSGAGHISRWAEQIPLTEIAAEPEQDVELRLTLDPFCDGRDAKISARVQHRGDHLARAWAAVPCGRDERSRDLQGIDREAR